MNTNNTLYTQMHIQIQMYIYINKYIIFKSTERSFWRARLEVSILKTHVGHIHQTSNQSKGDKTNCSSSTGSWKLSFCRCDSPRVLLAWLTHGDYMHLQPHSSMPWRFKMGQDRETLWKHIMEESLSKSLNMRYGHRRQNTLEYIQYYIWYKWQ